MRAVAHDSARKKAMHDAVMHSSLGGYPFSTGDLRSGALDGVRRLSGGNAGYSTAGGDEGYYPPADADHHAHYAPSYAHTTTNSATYQRHPPREDTWSYRFDS